MQEFIQTVNWRTTGYGIGYIVCSLVVARLFPGLQDVCEIVDKLIVGAAFVSSVDAARVRSVVRAVDVLAFKNKIDPASLTPVEPVPAEVKP